MSYQPPQQYGPPTGQWGGPPPPPPKKSKVVPILIGVGAFIIALGIISAIAGANTKTNGAAGATPATTQAAVTPATSAAAKKAAPAKAPASTVVLKESGHGIKSTVTFTVNGDWDLKYSYDCTSFGFAGNFIVTGPTLADYYVNELGKKGSDVTHLHDGGKLHLNINSECSWKIQVIDV